MATAARHVAPRRVTRGRPPVPRVRLVSRPKQRRVPFALFAVAVISALVLGLTGAQALVAQSSFRIEELTEETERLEQRYGELRLKAAELGAPERIARWAQDAGLVLRDPDDVRVVVVDASGRREPVTEAEGLPRLVAAASGG